MSSSPKPNRALRIAALAALSLLLAALTLWRTEKLTPEHPTFSAPADYHKYLYMAAHGPASLHIAPFCHRIGQPVLLSVMPCSPETGSLWLAFFFVAGTGLLIYGIGRHLGFSFWLALTGMLFFYATPTAAKQAFYGYLQPDASTYFFIALLLWLIVAGKDLAFVMALCLAIAFKESALFVVPLFYTLRAEKLIDLRRLLQTLAAAAPALLVFVLIRWSIPAWNDDAAYVQSLPPELSQVQNMNSHYGYAQLIREIGLPRFQNAGAAEMYQWTIGTFGFALMLFSIVGMALQRMNFLKWLPLLLLIYAQLLFAVNVERLLVAGIPLFVVFSLFALREMIHKLRAPEWMLVFIPLSFWLLSLVTLSFFGWPFHIQAGLLAAVSAGILIAGRLFSAASSGSRA